MLKPQYIGKKNKRLDLSTLPFRSSNKSPVSLDVSSEDEALIWKEEDLRGNSDSWLRRTQLRGD